MLSTCSFIRLLVCHQNPYAKTRYSQKLSNLELRCLLTTYKGSPMWAFQRTHYWTPKVQDEYRAIVVSQRNIIRWNLVHVIMQIWNLVTVTWPNTDVRHFKNRFLVITRQPIVRFQWNFAPGSSFFTEFRYRTDTVVHRMYFFVFLM